MGANRSQRRRQEREQIREWNRLGNKERVLSLERNGITQKDLDKSYKDGYNSGYMDASEKFFRNIYAACAGELIDAGNNRDDVISFLRGVDHRFSVMYDDEEEIRKVYDAIGVRINVDKNDIERFREVVK
jgi:hypothetical protein